ncbi:hypothetical protein KP509_07G047600 [Ceratopteris richardii]|uniref:Uncharacterized protein n=1 Tax=Ceratopteris richardii TaxID=49495 RepID=A0A8T2UC20_CERRI|nr:hypothetical protein KP509_07G047600 [Ceratopteris richardii]
MACTMYNKPSSTVGHTTSLPLARHFQASEDGSLNAAQELFPRGCGTRRCLIGGNTGWRIAAASSAMASSDPRLPSAARPYRPPLVNPQDLPPDYSSFLAILLVLQANMRDYENDMKQVVMAMTFVVMGFITDYFGPSRSRFRSRSG